MSRGTLTEMVEVPPPAVSQALKHRWAHFIKQVYETDPLLCPGCVRIMKIIAVIERPAVIRQILEQLSLSTGAAKLRAPPDPGRGQTADPLREWSYEPLG